MNDELKAVRLVDARGLICPEPVMMLHSAIRDAESGELIKIVATDPSTERDITKFCHFLNHSLEEQKKVDDEYIYIIRKG